MATVVPLGGAIASMLTVDALGVSREAASAPLPPMGGPRSAKPLAQTSPIARDIAGLNTRADQCLRSRSSSFDPRRKLYERIMMALSSSPPADDFVDGSYPCHAHCLISRRLVYRGSTILASESKSPAISEALRREAPSLICLTLTIWTEVSSRSLVRGFLSLKKPLHVLQQFLRYGPVHCDVQDAIVRFHNDDANQRLSG